MNHDQAQLLLGAYALDAVEPDEARELEDHLESCPRCRHELATLREAAGALSTAGGEAPPELWGRIAARLEESPPPLRLVGTGRDERPWRRRAAQAIAVVAAAAIAVLGFEVAHLQGRVGDLQAAVSRAGLAQAADAAVLSPSSRRIELTSATGSLRAEVAVRPDGQAFLVSSSLPRLVGDRTYQLWGLAGSRLVSLGLLGATPAPSAFRVGHGISALMITAEPAGGVVVPNSPVLVKARVGSD